MYYCFKCRKAYDLEWDSFKCERDPSWSPVRKYCPDRACSGYVYDIDDDMVPIIDSILNAIKDAETNPVIPFVGMTLHSCSGHWNDEIANGYPSVPYIAFAIMPKGITVEDSEYFTKDENRQQYFNSMRELITRGNYPEYADIDIPLDTQIMWNGFCDQDTFSHDASEGWIPVTVSISHSWIEEDLPSTGKPYTERIDAMMRHYEYIKMFLKVLESFRDNLMMLWKEELPDEE